MPVPARLDSDSLEAWAIIVRGLPRGILAAVTSGATNQTTYVYGVSTATGSRVNSNGLLQSITQPEDSAALYAYNTALGEAFSATDANGTVHSCAYVETDYKMRSV